MRRWISKYGCVRKGGHVTNSPLRLNPANEWLFEDLRMTLAACAAQGRRGTECLPLWHFMEMLAPEHVPASTVFIITTVIAKSTDILVG